MKRLIDKTAGGEIKVGKVMRDGKFLVITKDQMQANRLFKLTSAGKHFNISVSLAEKKNQVVGVIVTHDLDFVSDDEILTELTSQNVIAVKRITYRN
jgi:hypothetical protein